MVALHFHSDLFKDEKSQSLKHDLEEFLNREDINQKMTAVSTLLFPKPVGFPPGFPMSTMHLSSFLHETMTEDPHNIVSAIFQTWYAAPDSGHTQANTIRASLDSVVRGLKTILEKDTRQNPLHISILASIKDEWAALSTLTTQKVRQ